MKRPGIKIFANYNLQQSKGIIIPTSACHTVGCPFKHCSQWEVKYAGRRNFEKIQKFGILSMLTSTPITPKRGASADISSLLESGH